MAEVTKPIALDESFNTTESTPRNLADVLAEGLDNIAESVVPRAATEIPIESGSATNTKDYIDTKVGIETGSIAIPSTFNATINRQQLYKMGRVKLIDLVITLNQSLSGATHFINLQSNMQGENSYTDIIGTTKNGESFACYISGTAIYFNSNLTIASGTVICITGAYI